MRTAGGAEIPNYSFRDAVCGQGELYGIDNLTAGKNQVCHADGSRNAAAGVAEAECAFDGEGGGRDGEGEGECFTSA